MIKRERSPYSRTTPLSPTMLLLKVSLLILDLILRPDYEFGSVRRKQEELQYQAMDVEVCEECKQTINVEAWEESSKNLKIGI